MSFHRITAYEMQTFVDTLRHKKGPNEGKKLSRNRIVNILLVFKAIWKSASKKHRWKLDDPLEDKGEYLPKKKKKTFTVLRFAEWEAILGAMEPYYRPVVKLMMLTGLIASEIAALKKSHIRDGYLYIEESIVREIEKDDLKTDYRGRRYKLTQALTETLEEAAASSTDEYLFRMQTGKIFTAERFQRQVWRRALEKAGVEYRKPYITRHSFAAWALAIRIDQNRLVSLMGHANKQMIFEVYGKYVEGLEKDRLKILAFFGRDFKRG
jgi:integrase